MMKQSVTPRVVGPRTRARSVCRPKPAGGVDLAAAEEALALLESAAVGMASPFLGAAELALARAHNAELADDLAAERFEAATTSARRFHEVLLRNCPNHRLLGVIRSESCAFDGHRLTTDRPIRYDVVADHAILLAMIEDGASEQVVERFVRARCGASVGCLSHRPPAP
jgi:DNA-binding GntR family transcriptional regulator